jgi:hypothetical protein
MRDKFRANPANSDNLSRGLLLHRDGVRGLEQLAVVGSPEGRDATRVFTTRLRDGDDVHRASDLIADGHRRFEGAQAPVCRSPRSWCCRGWAGRSGAGQGRLYGELSPVVMAGQAIQQIVNFLAGDVGEFAGGCALGRRSRGLRVSCVPLRRLAGSGLLFVAQQGKVARRRSSSRRASIPHRHLHADDPSDRAVGIIRTVIPSGGGSVAIGAPVRSFSATKSCGACGVFLRLL